MWAAGSRPTVHVGLPGSIHSRLLWHIANNVVLAIAQATLLDILSTCPHRG